MSNITSNITTITTISTTATIINTPVVVDRREGEEDRRVLEVVGDVRDEEEIENLLLIVDALMEGREEVVPALLPEGWEYNDGYFPPRIDTTWESPTSPLPPMGAVKDYLNEIRVSIQNYPPSDEVARAVMAWAETLPEGRGRRLVGGAQAGSGHIALLDGWNAYQREGCDWVSVEFEFPPVEEVIGALRALRPGRYDREEVAVLGNRFSRLPWGSIEGMPGWFIQDRAKGDWSSPYRERTLCLHRVPVVTMEYCTSLMPFRTLELQVFSVEEGKALRQREKEENRASAREYADSRAQARDLLLAGAELQYFPGQMGGVLYFEGLQRYVSAHGALRGLLPDVEVAELLYKAAQEDAPRWIRLPRKPTIPKWVGKKAGRSAEADIEEGLAEL